MKFRTIVLGLFAALGLYACLNFLLLQRPVTLGYIENAYRAKAAAAEHLNAQGAPKIVLASGSNGLYSHRCETLTRYTGVACVNLAVSYIAGLQTILGKAEAQLRPGDILLLPLEYGFYGATEEELVNNTSGNRFIALYEPGLMRDQSIKRTVAVIFSLSLRDVFTSLGEMLFSRIGILRDTDQFQLNAQGDIIGHVRAKARQYDTFLAGEKGSEPNPGVVAGEAFAGLDVIRATTLRQAGRGVRVVGSLPTTFDDAQPSPEFIAWFKRFYADAGGRAIVLDNHSRYPRELFYNTKYHLNEEGQILHSRLLAEALCREQVILDCPVETLAPQGMTP